MVLFSLNPNAYSPGLSTSKKDCGQIRKATRHLRPRFTTSHALVVSFFRLLNAEKSYIRKRMFGFDFVGLLGRIVGHPTAQLVETLRYKPEVHLFGS